MNLMALKHSMAQIYENIKQKAENNELPDEQDVSQFVRLSRQMHMQADDAWLEEAEDFAHLATQLQQAVKNRNLEESIILVESLNDAQSYCHRTYKK